MKLHSVFLCALVLCGSLVASAEKVDAKAEASRFNGMYLAPMAGSLFYRLCDPLTGGMVEFRQTGKANVLAGPNGWHALRQDGNRITVTRPRGDGEDKEVRYSFKNGRPDIFSVGTDLFRMKLDPADFVCRGELPPLWDEAASRPDDLLSRKWPGRFAWPFYNPNRAAVLYGALALIGLWLFLFFDRRLWLILGAVGAVVSAACLFLTLSRAGFISVVLGGLLLVLLRFRRTGGRVRVGVLSGLALIGLVAFLACGGVGRLSTNWRDRGNAQRIEVWQSVPQMMVDAPSGWSGTTPGRAFMDWYQPVRGGYVTWTLVSSHLTALVKVGWCGRFLWILGWISVVICAFWAAWRGGSPLPVALWTMLASAGIFNPVLNSWTLWVLPVVSLALFWRVRPWREWRSYGFLLGVALLLSVCVVGFFVFAAVRVDGGRSPSIHADNGRVLVNGEHPVVWVVDDEKSLGWYMAAKDVRHFYEASPKRRPLGFVRDISRLPSQMDRLVLAGEQCRRFLKLWMVGKAPCAREVYFVSPPFGPGKIPPRLLADCRFAMILGEFAAQYVDVYGKAPFPDWVYLVPGAEVYIPGWVDMVTAKD